MLTGSSHEPHRGQAGRAGNSPSANKRSALDQPHITRYIMNSCHFFGRLGSDSKLATSKAGTAYLNFDLALNMYRKGQSETLWIRCTVFGKQAESLAIQLHKGTQVAVTGAIALNTFTDKDGKPRSALELVANSVTVAHQGAPAAPAAGSAVELADDIPF